MPKKLIFPARDDLWDPVKEEFITIKEQTLIIEHSLISISKWEKKWKKPFISEEKKTVEEFIDYIRCMTLNNVDDRIYYLITQDMLNDIDDYISDPMTATTFHDYSSGSGHKREIITAEIVYYSMISFGIPLECAKWHFNSLMALIRVFSVRNGDTKKMSPSEAAMFQRTINDKRLAAAKHRKR